MLTQPNNSEFCCSFTGEMLGNILTLLLWNSEFNKACDIMQLLDKEQHTILGVPKFEALSLFVDHCIQQKIPSRAIVSFLNLALVVSEMLTFNGRLFRAALSTVRMPDTARWKIWHCTYTSP